ncbi:MAG: hypothetical protein CM1200mP29_00850 [Verrucomicrobiota bacterium]|nr:MAG: hypothetical protein CM1200mP29_00850 [Verrucomicrobiota bacterium]
MVKGFLYRVDTEVTFPISGKRLRYLMVPERKNNTTTTSGQASDAQRSLVVSELMYHPSGDNLAEYLNC